MLVGGCLQELIVFLSWSGCPRGFIRIIIGFFEKNLEHLGRGVYSIGRFVNSPVARGRSKKLKVRSQK